MRRTLSFLASLRRVMACAVLGSVSTNEYHRARWTCAFFLMIPIAGRLAGEGGDSSDGVVSSESGVSSSFQPEVGTEELTLDGSPDLKVLCTESMAAEERSVGSDGGSKTGEGTRSATCLAPNLAGWERRGGDGPESEPVIERVKDLRDGCEWDSGREGSRKGRERSLRRRKGDEKAGWSAREIVELAREGRGNRARTTPSPVPRPRHMFLQSLDETDLLSFERLADKREHFRLGRILASELERAVSLPVEVDRLGRLLLRVDERRRGQDPVRERHSRL